MSQFVKLLLHLSQIFGEKFTNTLELLVSFYADIYSRLCRILFVFITICVFFVLGWLAFVVVLCYNITK